MSFDASDVTCSGDSRLIRASYLFRVNYEKAEQFTILRFVSLGMSKLWLLVIKSEGNASIRAIKGGVD